MTSPSPSPTLPGRPYILQRRQDRQILLSRLHQALSPAEQRAGLLGFTSLDSQEGLYFPGIRMIHTFFMKMPIDVAFLSPEGAVRDLHPRTPPWRIAFCREPGRAHTLETSAGTFQRWNLQPGDQLDITSA